MQKYRSELFSGVAGDVHLEDHHAEVSWLKELSWVEFSLIHVVFYLWPTRSMHIINLSQKLPNCIFNFFKLSIKK